MSEQRPWHQGEPWYSEDEDEPEQYTDAVRGLAEILAKETMQAVEVRTANDERRRAAMEGELKALRLRVEALEDEKKG